jgi:hypothetical protein
MERATSDPSAIALPVEIVELQDLKTAAGEPVTVLCERVDEFVYFKALGLPGLSMSEAEMKDKLDGMRTQSVESVRNAMPPIIEAGTAFVLPDGQRIAPAFTWSPDKHPRAIPGRFLSTTDLALLSATILRLSGFISGEAEALSFLVSKRKGGSEGSGASEVRESVRDDAGASSEGSEAR